MTKRLKEIYSVLPTCKVFADIGCDHGYMTKAMLDGGKCQTAIISDISEKCLSKAQTLLYKEIQEGKVLSVVGNGFERIDYCDLALIAGMGGEEIVSIITNAKTLPEKLVCQPMKNPEKVRVCAVNKGYKIQKDYVFFVNKIYYHLIVLCKGEDNLSDEEIEFGRTNLLEKPKGFLMWLNHQISQKEKVLQDGNLSEQTKKALVLEIFRLKKYV